MNKKRGILSLLFSLFFLLGAVPAWAVSPHSNWTLIRNCTPGSFFQAMAPSDTTFCYLSRVSVEETDTVGERATCRVFRDNFHNTWWLEATLDANANGCPHVGCSAYCYNN
jgi:hypothetical protein